MKKFFMIAVMAVAAITASAQTPEEGEISLTPMVGLTSGGFWGYRFQGVGNTPDRNGNLGFTVGAELGWMGSNNFKTTVGLHYISSSTEFKFSGVGSDDFKNDYLAIPILANYYITNGLAIKAGVQPAFLLSSKLSDSNMDPKEGVEKFDLTMPLGISYEFSNIVIDARYYFGVSNLVKDNCDIDGFNKLVNGYATITVGYKFNLK